MAVIRRLTYNSIIHIIGVLIGISIYGTLLIQESIEYWRLPDKPTTVTMLEAIDLARAGKRPLVHISDVSWNCESLIIVSGRTRSTNIALRPIANNFLIIVKYWGNFTCVELQNKPIAGVLQPIGKIRYDALKEDGFKFESIIDSSHVLELCGDCSRQNSLSELFFTLTASAIVGILLGLSQIGRFIQKLQTSTKPNPTDNAKLSYIEKYRRQRRQ